VTAATGFRAAIPFLSDLGVEFLAADAGRATIALQLQARHLNSWNVAHGGVIMTLLDVAMAVAGRSLDASAGGWPVTSATAQTIEAPPSTAMY
jgi:acyl-CoA thioesterase